MRAARHFLGFVDSAGHFALDDKAGFRKACAQYKGEEVLVTIKKKPRWRQRSYDQLRYWFGVPIAMLCEKTGYSKMQQHYICMALCFGVLVDEKTGLSIPVVPASRHLTTEQFSQAIEWVGPWAWEQFEIEIPLPQHVDLDSLPGADESEAA